MHLNYELNANIVHHIRAKGQWDKLTL